MLPYDFHPKTGRSVNSGRVIPFTGVGDASVIRSSMLSMEANLAKRRASSRTSNQLQPVCYHELPGSENDRWRRSPRPTVTRVAARMAIAALPLRSTTTTTALTAHSAPTCTVFTTTGASSSPSSSPSLTTPTLVPLLDANTPSTIRGSCETRAPQSHALFPVRVAHTRGPSTRSW